jgi:hypothetical protein
MTGRRISTDDIANFERIHTLHGISRLMLEKGIWILDDVGGKEAHPASLTTKDVDHIMKRCVLEHKKKP